MVEMLQRATLHVLRLAWKSPLVMQSFPQRMSLVLKPRADMRRPPSASAAKSGLNFVTGDAGSIACGRCSYM
jgi:hypothetical protein